MQFDIWVPKHNLCFEFQDSYHYATTWYHHNTQAFIKHKDEMKSSMARHLGVGLITVPCWWDGDVRRLISTIHFQRPDIVQLLGAEAADPICLNPLYTFFKGVEIPGVGELMLASLPHNSSGGSAGGIGIFSGEWWLGEKYDGIRCCWNAPLNEIYLRNGNSLSLPKCISLLPSVSADMELWFGRGQYLIANLALTDASQYAHNTMLRTIAFDVPLAIHHQHPFELRYQLLLHNVDICHPFATVATRMISSSEEHTALLVDITIADGGEGLILRRSGSRYESGRSLSLVKLKASVTDREGIVVGIGPKKSISLKLPNGLTFSVPTYNVHIPTLATGDIVTFTSEMNSRHQVPSNPTITRIRTDLSWDDVLHSFNTEHKADFTAPNSTIHSLGFWTHGNMREFLESFARSRNMDPLLPETWYRSITDIRRIKSGRVIITKFKGYTRAMQSLFPELSFNSHSFSRVFWGKMENRRQFFEKYAKQNRFDPLIAANWYLQFKGNILSAKGAQRVISYHRNSVARALLDLFPNIGLERRKLLIRPSSLWRNVVNHKLFFESYAREHAFDPSQPAGWYRQTKKRIMSAKDARQVMLFYNNNVSKALLFVFPNIGLQKHKLFAHTSSWHLIEQTRRSRAKL